MSCAAGWLSPRATGGRAARLACLMLVCPLRLFGQTTIQLSTVTAAPGEFAIVNMNLKSSAGQVPAALQWDVVIPAAQLQLQSERMFRPSLAAQDAGKSVTCAFRTAAAGTQAMRCILWGGRKPIPDGTIALISFRVWEGAAAGSARVRLEQVLGADPDAKPLMIDPAETVVTITR